MYSPKVQELVSRVPQSGRLEIATHRASAENPICGDRLELDLLIKESTVIDCRFRCSGCPGAIASGAALTYLINGKKVEMCRRIAVDDILAHLGGLPPHKQHGAQLAVEVLTLALQSDLNSAS